MPQNIQPEGKMKYALSMHADIYALTYVDKEV